ncbi:MAG TPA: peptidase M61 [Gammaproteobacteria bacterium]|nr:peptidase M61 [Gammaproteobacteria bacterium]
MSSKYRGTRIAVFTQFGAIAAAALLALACSGGAWADAADAGIPAPLDTPYPGTLQLSVDATDVAQGIFRATETIPVKPGELILLYPKWIPGNHEPSGPIDKFAGLTVTANGQALAWTRHQYDVYAFRVDVPQDVSEITLQFQYLSARAPGARPVEMTDKMLNLTWHKMLLYPAGYYARDIRMQASVKLPPGWQFGTALEMQSASGGVIRFKPTTLNTLVDSPMYAGEYFKRLDLDPGARVPVHMDMVADAPADLETSDAQVAALRALVTQAYRLFGSQHYDHYDFLVSFSDYLSGKGLEHHQSSEDGTRADFFKHWSEGHSPGSLLAHEYTHSWNGKFRRPADLWTPNFNVPMGDSLLWVYEGQTQYWGDVLSVRSGMWTQAQYHEALAGVAARYARGRPGFAWRTLQDTSNDPTIAQRAQLPYRSWQMSEDYYSAGQLIWLAVDCKIRALTHDRKSLDDFARDFFGIDNGSFVTRTYSFDDLVQALNHVTPYDWATFLRTRLDTHQPPLDGIEASGWKLVFNDQESKVEKQDENPRFGVSYTYSIGLDVAAKDGTITDVLWNGPAFKAGVSTGETLVAVNGRAYTADVMKSAITAAKGGTTPIELLLKYQGQYRAVAVDYHGGLQYPHLERIPGTPDYFDQIIAARM